jgi:hypothetical protein
MLSAVESSSADNNKGKIECPNAWETTAKIAIMPYRRCKEEVEKHGKLIAQALELIYKK